ncbi:hypothetical protein ACRAWB_18245 [Leifsonia poae]|uniref:hypothetical protein n=1 Tax=Leifsonia poae TaxID=110933 RepID=UPI003D69B9CA
MVDARIPERFLIDRRLLTQSDKVFRAWVTALLFSVANRTDGVIKRGDIPLMPFFDKTAPAALVAAGLWEANESGWLITDFRATQTSRDELEVLENARRREREKKQRQRAAKEAGGPQFRDVPGDVPGDASRGQDRQEGRTGSMGADEADERVTEWPTAQPGQGMRAVS